LFYLLRNRFYIGEVKYKDEILPGEQPAIMDRALFDAVQQKLTDQWTHPVHFTERERSSVDRTAVRRRRPSHGTDPRHQSRRPLSLLYLASAPYGESKIASVGSVPAFRRAISKTLSSIFSPGGSSFKRRIRTPASHV